MSLATIIAILGAINTLVSIAKNAPDVINEAKSLLAKVEPHIATANDDVKQAFAAAQAKVSAL